MFSNISKALIKSSDNECIQVSAIMHLHRLLDGVEVREPKKPLQYITLVLAEDAMNLNIA